MKPLSILHVCAPAPFGGLERVVQGLTAGLDARGHRVGLAAVVDPGTDTSALLGPLDGTSVARHVVEVPARAYFSERREIARLVRTMNPDVVHSHGYRPDILHGGRARRAGIATVTTLHGMGILRGRGQATAWLQGLVLPRFDGVIAVSEPLADLLTARGVARERIHVVPNAIAPPTLLARAEARARLGIPDEPRPVLGFVGRMDEVKGVDVLLRALRNMPAQEWTAVFIGDGPELEPMKTLAATLALDDRVRFAGAVASAGALFSAFDVFVLSSRSEGSPMVLLEAMASGVPVVATAVGGIPAMLAAPAQGWLVPADDDAALATALTHALRDAPERAARAARAIERIARDFSVDVWLERHEAVYAEAMRVRASVHRG